MARSLPAQIVQGAINIIQEQGQWCREAEAKTYFGIPCKPHRFYALQFCAQGAIKRSAYRMIKDKEQAEQLALRIIAGFGGLATVNDHRGRQQVLAKMRTMCPV